MKFKQLIAGGTAAVMALSLAACGQTAQEGDSSTGSTQELEKITVCLDWTPNTNHTGLYVAQAKGYFADAGFEVEIVQPPEGGSASMCASGQAQFAIEAQDTMAASLALDEPLPITAVAALIQHNTSGILSRKGEGMDTPKGMENHTYSTWDNPIEQAILKNVIEADGGDYSKVQLIPNNITDEAAALSAHQTDSVWIYYAWGGINAELSGLEFDYFALRDLNPTFDYYTPVLIANNDYLAQHGDRAKAFLNAVKQGYEYAIANPEEAAQILIDGDTTGSLKGSEELVTASQKWLANEYKSDVEQWGYIDPARWDGFYQWLWENQLIAKELPAGTGFSNDYLS